MEGFALLCGHLVGDYIFQNDWMASRKTSESYACLVHCIVYTVSLLVFAGDFVGIWIPMVAGVIHFPIDRWRLARRFMGWNGQEAFASGSFAPWSIIVVDNTIHLVTLFVLWKLRGVFG